MSLPSLEDPRRLTYPLMWDLIKSSRFLSLPAIYTDELLIAIFWEESTFCNIREVRRVGGFGPAVGFGQINDTEFWRFPECRKEQLTNMILGDPGYSVTFAGRFLYDLHQRLNGNRGSVLKGYAGVNANPVNIRAYNGWIACESILRKPHKNTFKTSAGHLIPSQAVLKQALHAAKANGDLFFDQILKGIP